ncbi:MAG TPA: hypothetical protein RMH85_16535 [Polyangiaceae bacterium LLY-WYZ-15_(1-7)]|nr:hypothetical protein [Myxococcales bacterium]MAT24129.1 hypothetical protein [Sandaracinus sp.]HJK93273.1 hypothetical protein [Polyangiaceae bacterium LLY-WYZ-15_(1-7)]HJL01279.1 hypothetical protein [Polyangiaceae bacterium LLY-WYZ-15_(1-7)]HJL10109.1 hypothetical protein [Polyangiaceae bacterium LLY-WYZ-15_(1-7)]
MPDPAPDSAREATAAPAPRAVSIWWFAFGYFACYVPYSAITKAISSGWPDSLAGQPIAGFRLLPISVAVSATGMFVFITAMRWWRYANHRRFGSVSLPWPRAGTFLSGLCTAAIVGTTTLAYTFDGISIVFMMLLMRGGVLVIAPVVDVLVGRKVRWFSAVALALSLGALIVAFAEEGSFAITLVAAVDVAVYLTSYFLRFRFMSKLAKSDDTAQRTAYFVEEQMVATPALLLGLVVAAAIGEGEILGHVRAGFTEVAGGPALLPVILIGALSQGTGIFGSLIFLDPRENTYCVPVNRSSSILAGVLASTALMLVFEQAEGPSAYELAGAGLIIAAILALSVPALLPKDRADDADA